MEETKVYSHGKNITAIRVLKFENQEELLEYFVENFETWKSQKMATKVIGSKLLIFKKGE